MPVRPTMLNLVHFVRRKIGDPDTGSATFSTLDIQDALDATRTDVFNEALIPRYQRTSTGIFYYDHFSKYGFYEDGEVLLANNLQTITASVREVMREDAHWQFSVSQFPPVWILTGASYDPYRVSADLLEQIIAGQATLNVDFSAGGSRFTLSQITDTRLKLIASYRAKQRPVMVDARRHDALSPEEYKREQKVGPENVGIPFLTGP